MQYVYTGTIYFYIIIPKSFKALTDASGLLKHNWFSLSHFLDLINYKKIEQFFPILSNTFQIEKKPINIYSSSAIVWS